MRKGGPLRCHRSRGFQRRGDCAGTCEVGFKVGIIDQSARGQPVEPISGVVACQDSLVPALSVLCEACFEAADPPVQLHELLTRLLVLFDELLPQAPLLLQLLHDLP